MVRERRAARSRRRESRRRHVPPLADVVAAFREHDLLTFSSALAFRVLASLVPLTLLALALLGALGLESVWRESVGPRVEERVTMPVYFGVDYTVERIFDRAGSTLIPFALLLTLWHVSRGVRIVMKALNVIHDQEERRPAARLWLNDVALAVVLATMVTAAFVLVVTLPRLGGGGATLPLQVVALLGAAALLGVAVTALVRYGPAERPDARWASAGSALVVLVWLLASLAFGWWAGSVADYRSAVGTLFAFLLLTAYVLTSTTIFLVGAQLDELARKGGRRG